MDEDRYKSEDEDEGEYKTNAKNDKKENGNEINSENETTAMTRLRAV